MEYTDMQLNEVTDKRSELNDLFATCLKHVMPVTEPLALISQIQRSGGSLLSQLFDGHPQIHAHPHELKIGYPKKYAWPKLNLDEQPEQWLVLLFEDIVLTHMKEGYKKLKKENITHRFVFMPSLQKKIFLQHIDSVKPTALRDVYDAYMTSYFGAWLNNFNLSGQPKKYVVGFIPRFAMRQENMTDFFEIYPDGKLISIVRDPKNWFPSASRHKPHVYPDVKVAINQWRQSVQATIWNKDKFGERVCIIRFEDLIAETETVMRYLSDFLKIEFNAIMLEPTFNLAPIRANTSFELEKQKIVDSTLYRYKTLSPEDLNMIQTMTAKEYELALDKSVQFNS